MLGLRRRSAKTHAQLMRDELSESLDHFVQAANHAAGGVGATVGPRAKAARERVTPAADKVKHAAATGLGSAAAVLTPVAVASKDASRKARRKSAKAMKKEDHKTGRRWPRLATLLAAGAAVGAAGALVMRRRRRQEWEEYDPSRPMESASTAQSETLSAATSDLSETAPGTGTTRMSTSGPGGTSAGMATPVPGAGLATPTGTETTTADDLIGRSTSSNNSRG